jgi:hypothetical protein
VTRRSLSTGGLPVTHDVEHELAHITTLSLPDLRAAWAERFGGAAAAIRSRDVLLRHYAWQIQANAFGGLDAKTGRKLASIADALEGGGSYEPRIERSLSPGIVLTREWKGVLHSVTVTVDGFLHLGKSYGSLSDVARTITGTRWSGPRFFGLEQKPIRSGRKKAVP